MMVGGNQAFNPIMDQAGIGAGVTTAKCKGCKYDLVGVSRDICMEQQGCPLNPHQSISCAKHGDNTRQYKPIATDFCQFPGCKKKSLRGNNLCERHNKTVYNRRVIYNWPEDRWLEPINRSELTKKLVARMRKLEVRR